MEDKNEINSYKDVDLDSISVDITDDYDDNDDIITQGGNYGGGGSKKKLLIIIGSVVAAIILIVGIFFGVKAMISKPDKKADPKVEQTSNGGSKEIFKLSIKDAVDSQAAKYDVSVAWKDATLDYGQSGNLESYQNKLQDLNTQRESLLNSIEEDGNDLNNLVRDSLNNMRTYLEKAFNASNPDEAINSYNEWQESDGIYDKEYLDKLTELLDKNKIEHKIDDHNGGIKIEY